MLASPNMKARPQLLSLQKPSRYDWLSSKLDLDLFYEKNVEFGLGVGLAFSSIQLSTQVPSLTSKKCCHVGIHVILGTWDPMWSGKSQLPCSQRLRLHILISSHMGLTTWCPVWTGPRFHLPLTLDKRILCVGNKHVVILKKWWSKSQCHGKVPLTMASFSNYK